METPRNGDRTTTASNPDLQDSRRLKADHGMIGWIALSASVIALVWGVMSGPDTGRAYKTSPSIEHREAASNAHTP